MPCFISHSANPVALRNLATALQPRTGYWTGCQGPAETVFTPLNCLVSALPAESVLARHFKNLSKRIVAGTATPEDWQQAREWLTVWKDNDAKLQPLLSQSSLTAGLGSLSSNVSQTAAIGLEALSDLKASGTAASQWREQSLKFLNAAQKPQGPLGNLVNVLAPSVEMLVRATKTQ